jgi:hypothetical protein
MTHFATESTLDDNTGLECWLVIDTRNGAVMDRMFDRQDAVETAMFYQDMEDESVYDQEDDGQPDEFTEWMDFDCDC